MTDDTASRSRLEDRLAEPIEHPTSDRLLAFVVGRADDAEASVIEEHLEHCESCRTELSFLSDADDSFVGRIRSSRDHEPTLVQDGPEEAPPPKRTPAPPGYEILEEIGRGGMGVVHKARHIRLKRLVALKTMLAGRSAGRADLERFRAEAETIARLRHPNIVRIYEIGEFDGLTYLALEYVSGGNLHQCLDGRPQPPRSAAELVATLARAMSEAHRKGVIHRDLKPGNILIDPDVEDAAHSEFRHGSPKVTDFGLAKWLTDIPESGGAQTLAGTPSYMAPEQVTGRPATAATDIHALGSILYEALTGRPPFQGTSTVETFFQVETIDPVPPRRLQPGIPRDIETICLKCLRKQPDRRYASAKELAEDLERFLQSLPIQARPMSWVEGAARHIRRRPAVSALVVALAMVGMLGLAGVLWQWRDAVRQRNRAEVALMESDDNLYYSRIARAQIEWRQNHDIQAAAALLEACIPAEGQLDRRGWEWNYLKALTQRTGRLLNGESSQFVSAVAFSRDGKLAASVGDSPFVGDRKVIPNTLTLWDRETGRMILRLKGTGPVARCLSFRPDGREVAMSAGSRVLVWEIGDWLDAGRPSDHEPRRRELEGNPQGLTGLAYSPDGRRLAASRFDGGLLLWELADGRLRTSPPMSGRCYGVGYAPGGRIATTRLESDRLQLLLWNPSDGSLATSELFQTKGVAEAAFSADGKLLAVASDRLRIWDVESGRLLNVLGEGRSRAVLGVAFHPDGIRVGVAMSDHTARVWDRQTGEERTVYRGHTNRTTAVAFDAAGRWMLSGGQQPGEVRLWELGRDLELTRFPSPSPDGAEAIGFHPSGKGLRSAYPGGAIFTHDLETGEASRISADMSQAWISPGIRAVFSDDGTTFAATTGEKARSLRSWRLDPTGGTETLVENPPIPTFAETAYQVDLSADGSRLASATLARRPTGVTRVVRVHDIATGSLVFESPPLSAPEPRYYGGLDLSPDGTLLAYDDYRPGTPGTPRKSLTRVRDLSDGRERWVFPGESDLVSSLAFSGGGERLAIGYDGEVRIWSLATGRRDASRAMKGPSYHLAFSPDGRRLAGVDRDYLKLWDARTGQEILSLRGAAYRGGDLGINPKVAWSPDGLRLAVTNHDRSITIWDATTATEPLRDQPNR